MRATKWRKTLVGDLERLTQLRDTCEHLLVPNTILDETDLNNDLERTFPTLKYTSEQLRPIKNVLKTYAHVNREIGYMQGMCFIAFVLHHVYSQDNMTHVKADTYYSLTHIIGFIRPVYPIHSRDSKPAEFLENMAKLIRIKLIYKHPLLADKLRKLDYIKTLIIRTIPALFANYFTFDDTVVLWDYLFDGDIFENIINCYCAILVCNKQIYLHMNDEKIYTFILTPCFYRVASIVSAACGFRS
jgi:hypothetical protein